MRVSVYSTAQLVSFSAFARKTALREKYMKFCGNPYWAVLFTNFRWAYCKFFSLVVHARSLCHSNSLTPPFLSSVTLAYPYKTSNDLLCCYFSFTATPSNQQASVINRNTTQFSIYRNVANISLCPLFLCLALLFVFIYSSTLALTWKNRDCKNLFSCLERCHSKYFASATCCVCVCVFERANCNRCRIDWSKSIQCMCGRWKIKNVFHYVCVRGAESGIKEEMNRQRRWQKWMYRGVQKYRKHRNYTQLKWSTREKKLKREAPFISRTSAIRE